MFIVDDVERTAEWYREKLGFEIGEYFREDHGPHGDGSADDEYHAGAGEALFVIVERDGQRVMFGRSHRPGHGVFSNATFRPYSSDAYFWVDGVREYFETVKQAGVEFHYELELQPYGLEEFAVKDCDGRALTFGGPPSGE
jgi:uncharacterized glyoxalase superfamily protein PhnB